jgi:putative polyhydroxyalkanoate system protein
MSTISISRKHKKTMAQARTAVDRVAERIAEKFGIEHQWEGDTLHFTRSGVDGHIELAKGSVKVQAKLGFLLMALRGSVEEEIERYLDKEFGT